ncbi:MAG: DsbA family protein [Patescibacteria group bacterium]
MSQEAKILTGIGIVTVAIIAIGAFSFGGSSTPDKNAEEILSVDAQKSLVRENSHKKEAENEKVTIVEFGDFQCPACGVAHPVVEQILEEYKDNVTFVFRQYPLPSHKNARLAAEASEAAGDQGKFFEMYNVLYQNQADWGESDKARDAIEKYAEELELDMEKFIASLDKKAHDAKIQADVNDGNAVGVKATPTFYINGEQITGGLPYNEFKEKIEAAMSKAAK